MFERSVRRSRPIQLVWSYGCAVFWVAAALGITLWAGETAVGVSPLFFAAVVLSAWRGGLGPGILATGLAGLVTAYYFIEPVHSLQIGMDDAVRVLVFTGVALLISYLQEASKRAEAEAARASRAKDDFLAVLSHELRNPLTPALAAADALGGDDRLPADLRGEAALIRRNIELEVRLIDELLDLTRSRRGVLALRLEPTDAHELISESVAVCKPEVEQKRIRLQLRLDAARSLVRADGIRLRQVLWNVLKNAAKFTPAGGSVTVTTANTSAGYFEIEVADTGVGIDPAVLPRIFDPFDQGDPSTSRQFGGLGLGLAIARSIVEAHGGHIEASSPGRGKGATIRLRLPAAAAVRARAAPAPKPRSVTDDSRPPLSILLVEDDPDSRRVMARILRSAGDAVRATGSCAEARQAADRFRFDLVIGDLTLPDGSGLELMQELRAAHGLDGVVISGHGSEADLSLSRSAGFKHLVKPVSVSEILDAVSEHAGSTRGAG
jgi:signal transduction histidine kinase/ActR/RegA family two-component response regulator